MAAIGFIGASGLMGHGMAKNLLAKGHALSLTVHRNRERVADLLAAGAKECGLRGRARSHERDRLPVRHRLAAGRGIAARRLGLLAGARRGLVVVDCSTSEPDSTARLRDALRRAGRARSSTRRSRARRSRPRRASSTSWSAPTTRPSPGSSRCCARFAENVFHVGGPGAGHIVKLLNNFIAQAICTATAEAFAVGQRAGIDPQKLVDIVSVGAVNSGLFQMMAKTLNGEMDALKFELDNARKDVRYYTHLAEGLAIPTVVGEAVHQSLVLASALGHGRKFVPSLVEAQEQLTGARLVP